MEIKPTNLILRAMICLLTSFETAQSFEARAPSGARAPQDEVRAPQDEVY